MRKNQNTLLIVRTCNWSAHAEERRSQVCLLGNHWMGGPIPEARKIDGSGSWTSTKTFVWTQRWSVGQQRSPGGNWGWELRGEIWAGELGWSLGVAIWKMMLKSMGKWVGWCRGEQRTSLLLLPHLWNPVQLPFCLAVFWGTSAPSSSQFGCTSPVISSHLDDYSLLDWFSVL